VDPTRSLPGTHAFADVLRAKDIPHELDVWGWDVPHDWPSWRAQLRHHLPRFC
jgi:esterase/lipase superfamily enzyme